MKKVFKVIYYVMFVFAVIVLIYSEFISKSLLNTNKFFAPEVWTTSSYADVKKVTIFPALVYYNPAVFTIESNIVLMNRDTIRSLWKEMQGKTEWEAGNWGTNRAFRVVFELNGGQKVAFVTSLHMKSEMAAYRLLSSTNDIYSFDGLHNNAKKGGKQLSLLLKEIIRQSGVRWVNSSEGYWIVNSGTDLIFQGVPENDIKEKEVQEVGNFNE